MHHCLYISEILYLVFQFAECTEEEQFCRAPRPIGKRTLASLARTCRVFSSPALDVLWRDLDDFQPLLAVFPTVTSATDDSSWATFSTHAKRVKSFYGCEARVPVHVQHDFITALQHCPDASLPLLPNLSSLAWTDRSFSHCLDDCGIPLLRYLASPSVTTVSLTLVRWRAHSTAQLDVLADLPRLCPHVTAFSISLGFTWDYDITHVARMITAWPRLHALRTCTLSQHTLDSVLARAGLGTLALDFHADAPRFTGHVPDTVHTLMLRVDSPTLGAEVLTHLTAAPVRLTLHVATHDATTDADRLWTSLAERLDAGRLRTLVVAPCAGIPGISQGHPLAACPGALLAFRGLETLDLDGVCTARVDDGAYARLACTLAGLRCLKMGTARGAGKRASWPAATVGAVVAVVMGCRALETLHVVFDASVLPPLGESASVRGEWVNRRMTSLCVGNAPIREATVPAIGACLKSILPCVVRIEHRNRDREWGAVQDMLVSG